jgi:hypothetical protein
MLTNKVRNILSCLIVVLLLTSIAAAAPTRYEDIITDPYKVKVSTNERAAIHSRVDDISDLLINTVMEGAKYDTISYGGALASQTYPFAVANTEANRNEGMRKAAKLTWAMNWAKSLGFDRVVRYQPHNYVYVEIGDPDAPEMVMAFSHLDSPTASINANNRSRWVDETGKLNPDAYIMPYIKDGWIYGCGIQDDSGPTLATLISLKVAMDAKLPSDRRIRVVMGAYEDSSPSRPSVANALAYMDIPFPYSTTTYYDGWVYKYLNREEMPIAGFSSDSRFPMNIGTRREIGAPFMYNLSGDAGKGFKLVSADMHVTTRPNEPTIIDLIGASGTHIPSQGRFRLSLAGVPSAVVNTFKNAVTAEIAAKDWAQQERVILQDIGDDFVMIANSWKPVDAVTPQYGLNGVLMAMHLINKGFEAISSTYPDINNLEFRKMVSGTLNMFMPDGVQDCFGTAIGLYERNQYTGVPMMTISFGQLMTGASNLTTHQEYYNPQPLYPVNIGAANPNMFLGRIYAGAMYSTEAEFNAGYQKMVDAITSKGWTLITNAVAGGSTFPYIGGSTISTAAPTFGSGPPMHLAFDNLQNRLLLASYRNSVSMPNGMVEPFEHLDISYPTGSTGGNFSSDYWNKMIIFGAIIPGNERWFHTANERMTVKSLIQTAKICTDALVELSRYSGPAGAQVMWADIPGYNSERADLDLLDVTLGTYKDASGAVPAGALTGQLLASATTFDIPMFSQRWNTSATTTQIANGHNAGGVYLPLNNAHFLANNYVLPMRLEFKLTRQSLGLDSVKWVNLRDGSLAELLSHAKFGIVREGAAIPLTLPGGMDTAKFFSKRVSAIDPSSLYVSINLAIADTDADMTPTPILANSKTDLFKLNPEYVAANGVPAEMKGRGEEKERGFFLFGDGAKNARFTSPQAVYMTIDPKAIKTLSTKPGEFALPPFGGPKSDKFPTGNEGVTAEVTQNADNGAVNIVIDFRNKLEIDRERLFSDDGWLSFFFYSATSDNPVKIHGQAIESTGGLGLFTVRLDYDELIAAGLKPGDSYVVHYSNASGTIVGYNTFSKGAFSFKEVKPSPGCDAGFAGALAFVAVLLLRRKTIR